MSKVITVRVPEEIYDKLYNESIGKGYKNFSDFLQTNLAALANSGTIYIPSDSCTTPSMYSSNGSTKTRQVQQDKEKIDIFFSQQSSVGEPHSCPRCLSKAQKPTISYNKPKGGVWSCPACHANGTWGDEEVVQIVHKGLALTQAFKDDLSRADEQMLKEGK